MEDGQKIKIALDSVLDSNTADMLCDINNPKLIFNRQVLQGGYLPTSVRFEHNGWFCGEYGYDYSIVPEKPINGGILGDILVSKKSNYINCIYHCKSDNPEIQFDVYPETRIIKKEHYDYTIEHIFEDNAHILKITGKTAIFNNRYTFYIDVTDLNNIKPAREGDWENVDPNINNGYFTTCHFMTEDLFKSGVYYTRKLVNGRLQYAIANEYSETEAYYKRIPVSNKFDFDPDKYIYSFKVYDQDKTFSDTISIYFGKTFYIGDDVYTYSMHGNNIKWSEYISCIYNGDSLTMVTIEDSSDVQDIRIENGNGMLKYAIDINATDTINITVDDYFMDINFSSGSQQKEYIGNTPADSNDNTITSNYWYANFFNDAEAVTCEVKLPVWIGLGIQLHGELNLNKCNSIYAQADVSNLYLAIKYKGTPKATCEELTKFVKQNICKSKSLGAYSDAWSHIIYNDLPNSYKNSNSYSVFKDNFFFENTISTDSLNFCDPVQPPILDQAYTYDYDDESIYYYGCNVMATDSNNMDHWSIIELKNLIYTSKAYNYINTWHARFNICKPEKYAQLIRENPPNAIAAVTSPSPSPATCTIAYVPNIYKCLGFNYISTPGFIVASIEYRTFLSTIIHQNEQLFDGGFAAVYPKIMTVPSYVPAGIIDCTQGDPDMVMSYGKYYGSEDMVKAALNTFDFSSLIAIDASWQTVADKYTLEAVAKAQIKEDGQLNKPYDYGIVYSSNPWVNNSYTGNMYEECAVDYSIDNFWPFSKVPCFNLAREQAEPLRHVYYANDDLSVIIDNLDDYKAFIKNGSSFVNLPFVDNEFAITYAELFRHYHKIYYNHLDQNYPFTVDFDLNKLDLYDHFGYVSKSELLNIDNITVMYNGNTYNAYSDEVLLFTDLSHVTYDIYTTKLLSHIDFLGTSASDTLYSYDWASRYYKTLNGRDQAIKVEPSNKSISFNTYCSITNDTLPAVLKYPMYINSLYNGLYGESVQHNFYAGKSGNYNILYANFSPRCVEPFVYDANLLSYYPTNFLKGKVICDTANHAAQINSDELDIRLIDCVLTYASELDARVLTSIIGNSEADYMLDVSQAYTLASNVISMFINDTQSSIFNCDVSLSLSNVSIGTSAFRYITDYGEYNLYNTQAYGSHDIIKLIGLQAFRYENKEEHIHQAQYIHTITDSSFNGLSYNNANATNRFNDIFAYARKSHFSIYNDSATGKVILNKINTYTQSIAFCHLYSFAAFDNTSYNYTDINYMYATSDISYVNGPLDSEYNLSTSSRYNYSTHYAIRGINNNVDNLVGSLVAPAYYVKDSYMLTYVGGHTPLFLITHKSSDDLAYLCHYSTAITIAVGELAQAEGSAMYNNEQAHFSIANSVTLLNKLIPEDYQHINMYKLIANISFDKDSKYGKCILRNNIDYTNIIYNITADILYNINTGTCSIENPTFTDKDDMFYQTLLSNSTKVTPITKIKKGVNNNTIYMAVPVWGYGKFTISINNDQLDSKSSNIFNIKEADKEDRDPNKLWIDKDITGSDGFNSVTGIKCIAYTKGEFYPVNVADWSDTIQPIIIHANSCWFYYTTDNDAVPSYINGNSNLVSGSDSTCTSSILGNNETLINTHWNIASYKMLLAASVNTTCAYYHNLCCVQGIHAYNAEIVFANREQAIAGRITRDNYTPDDLVYINIKHVDSKFDYMLAYDMTDGKLDYKNIYESVNNTIDPEDIINGEVSNE